MGQGVEMSEVRKQEDSHDVARRIFWITLVGAGIFSAIVFTVILPNW